MTQPYPCLTPQGGCGGHVWHEWLCCLSGSRCLRSGQMLLVPLWVTGEAVAAGGGLSD